MEKYFCEPLPYVTFGIYTQTIKDLLKLFRLHISLLCFFSHTCNMFAGALCVPLYSMAFRSRLLSLTIAGCLTCSTGSGNVHQISFYTSKQFAAKKKIIAYILYYTVGVMEFWSMRGACSLTTRPFMLGLHSPLVRLGLLYPWVALPTALICLHVLQAPHCIYTSQCYTYIRTHINSVLALSYRFIHSYSSPVVTYNCLTRTTTYCVDFRLYYQRATCIQQQ